MCQTKDVAIKDWVKLAVQRARLSGDRTIFWLDKKRGHDKTLIGIVNQYLEEHDTSGLDISIMRPVDAIRVTCERASEGKNTITVTGNVLRDYLTDLFPILELGTSAKMLSIVPLLNGGGVFETGAGGSAPKHVQQFVRCRPCMPVLSTTTNQLILTDFLFSWVKIQEGHLRWDSLGEYLALAACFERIADTKGNAQAKLLGDCLNKAVGRILKNRKSPSRVVNQIDNRATNYYVALYWADFLQQEDPKYKTVFEALSENRSKIVEEFKQCQGKPVDLGGYYLFDPEKTTAAMNPSATLNEILKSLDL
jgi:isocitrate dehydrogenase